MNNIITPIFRFLGGFFNPRNYNLHNYAAFLLVLMCIQYIPLETRAGVSPVKVGAMCFTLLLFIRYFHVSKATIFCALYYGWVMFTAYILNPLTFRAATVLYLGMFVFTFAAFYNIVYFQHVFTIDSYINFLRNFIYVFTGVLVVQQVCLVIGINYLPIINLAQILDRGIGANSLSFEPSSFARTMLVLYYCYLKCNEYKTGNKVSIKDAFSGMHTSVTICFLWSMFTMGSGTAFICLAILSIYFMKGWWFLLMIPIFIGTVSILNYLEVEQFQRAQAVVEVLQDEDVEGEDIRQVDTSASVRISPILNTINNMDFFKYENIVGGGCDTNLRLKHTSENYAYQINDYGIIGAILGFLLVFTCCIRFFSLATIMFFASVGGGVGNISYAWGLLMLFMCTRYFYEEYKE